MTQELRALVGGRLIAGTGQPAADDSVVILEGERIKSVGSRADTPIPKGAEVVELGGKTLMPGLINCHVHICMDGSPDPVAAWKERSLVENVLITARHAESALRAGVTTMRDLRGWDDVDTGLKAAIESGVVAGPRMLVSGQVSMRVKGPEEARQAAREQIEAGFDIIKMTGSARLRFDELKAVVEEAEAAGKPTATHALGAPGVKDAIRAGVRSIEHGYYLDDEGIAMMVERGTFLVPTLASVHLMVQRGSGAGIPSFMMEMAKRAAEEHPASFRRAWEAGVRIAAGNDGGTPFNPASNLASELERLVAAGLTPAQALDAAQGTAAELLNLTDRIGTVEAGKLADLVVLDADPLVDISNVRRVSMVFKGGWQVPNPGLPAALRSALEEAA